MRSAVEDFQAHTLSKVEEKDQAWFWDQLTAHCPEVIDGAKDYKIHCPAPDHIDSNPSCGVDKNEGYWHCFSCGAGGGWNSLVPLLGVEPLKYEGADASIEAVKHSLSRSLAHAGVRPKKRDPLRKARPLVSPWEGNWRGIRSEVLENLGCQKVVDLSHGVTRIGLPIRTVEGSLIGYVCRVVTPKDAKPRFLPLAADRMHWREKELPISSSLFLVERVIEENWDRVVLVEGPYDALRLYSRGVPAVAILGAGAWTKEKCALLLGLGLNGVVVLMDNDEAGRSVQADVVNDLRGSLKVKPLSLPNAVKDPGGLSLKQTKWVHNTLLAL